MEVHRIDCPTFEQTLRVICPNLQANPFIQPNREGESLFYNIVLADFAEVGEAGVEFEVGLAHFFWRFYTYLTD